MQWVCFLKKRNVVYVCEVQQICEAAAVFMFFVLKLQRTEPAPACERMCWRQRACVDLTQWEAADSPSFTEGGEKTASSPNAETDQMLSQTIGEFHTQTLLQDWNPGEHVPSRQENISTHSSCRQVSSDTETFSCQRLNVSGSIKVWNFFNKRRH